MAAPNKIELFNALNHLFDLLVEKGMISPADAHQNKLSIINSIVNSIDANTMAQLDLQNPAVQKTMALALICTYSLKKSDPHAEFNAGQLFKNALEMKPDVLKNEFKKLLTALNKLEPDPSKRRTDEQIDEWADALAVQVMKRKNLDEKEALENAPQFEKQPGVTSAADLYIMAMLNVANPYITTGQIFIETGGLTNPNGIPDQNSTFDNDPLSERAYSSPTPSFMKTKLEPPGSGNE